MKKEKEISKHTFVFNPNDNGGEGLDLITHFIDNGVEEVYTHQELVLNSYCNCAIFNLMGAQITPENLRELANQLETATIEAHSRLRRST